MKLERYNKMHKTVLEYPKKFHENWLINKDIKLIYPVSANLKKAWAQSGL